MEYVPKQTTENHFYIYIYQMLLSKATHIFNG